MLTRSTKSMVTFLEEVPCAKFKTGKSKINTPRISFMENVCKVTY